LISLTKKRENENRLPRKREKEKWAWLRKKEGNKQEVYPAVTRRGRVFVMPLPAKKTGLERDWLENGGSRKKVPCRGAAASSVWGAVPVGRGEGRSLLGKRGKREVAQAWSEEKRLAWWHSAKGGGEWGTIAGREGNHAEREGGGGNSPPLLVRKNDRCGRFPGKSGGSRVVRPAGREDEIRKKKKSTRRSPSFPRDKRKGGVLGAIAPKKESVSSSGRGPARQVTRKGQEGTSDRGEKEGKNFYFARDGQIKSSSLSEGEASDRLDVRKGGENSTREKTEATLEQGGRAPPCSKKIQSREKKEKESSVPETPSRRIGHVGIGTRDLGEERKKGSLSLTRSQLKEKGNSV